MIVNSYKTSPTIARINIDIAMTEVEDFLAQASLVLSGGNLDKLGLQIRDLEQINALRAHFAKVYDQNR